MYVPENLQAAAAAKLLVGIGGCGLVTVDYGCVGVEIARRQSARAATAVKIDDTCSTGPGSFGMAARRRPTRSVAVATVVGMIMVWIFVAVLEGVEAGPSGGDRANRGAAGPPTPLAAAPDAPQVEQGRLGTGVASALDSANSPLASPPAEIGDGSGGFDPMQWPGSYRRVGLDLAYLMMSGQYEAWNLARHPCLNPADRVMPPEVRRELSDLVTRLKAASAGFRRAAGNMAAKDRVAEIEAGRVAPIEEPPLTKEEVRARTDRIVQYFENRGESLSTQEAARKLEKGEAWTVNRPLASGQTLHQGKVYEHKEFASLPGFDRMFEGLRYLAMQELGTLIAWFEGSGYTAWSPELHEVMARLQTMSPREMGRLARDAGRGRR